jgi:mannosyl-3-phosphoglycerate phosphatase
MRASLSRRAPARIVLFSDLDGTLLDRDDYSFDRALPALEVLREKAIPVVFCTSKTRSEVELYRHLLDNHHPFVVENGGAVFVPDGYFEGPFEHDRVSAGYLVRELGAPYQTQVDALARVRRRSGARLRGFSDMTTAEVAERCNLSLDRAALAREREYDEPFLILDRGATPRVLAALGVNGAHGAPITRGDRFHHLCGGDKGRAVSVLMALFRRAWPDVSSVGIGNRLNDLPLLEAVDFPILVATGDGDYDHAVSVAGLRYADGVGPKGWNAAVMELLHQGLLCGGNA